VPSRLVPFLSSRPHNGRRSVPSLFGKATRGRWPGRLVAGVLSVAMGASTLTLATVPSAPAAVAAPAVGSLVGTVNFGQQCGSNLGVGIAYDGANLWYSCYASNPDLVRADAITGAVTASYNIAGGLGALAYDASRNVIWAGSGGTAGNVYRISLNGQRTVTGSAMAFNTCGESGMCDALDDGLAYDATNDTLYISPDGSTTIHHYSPAGVHLSDGPNGTGDFTWAGTGCYNSGLALGGTLLYEGADGCNMVWVVDKATPATVQFSFSTVVAGDPNFRDEGMSCDPNTFAAAGSQVMWSKEAYAPMRAHAFAVPAGSCTSGGASSTLPIGGAIPPGETAADGSPTVAQSQCSKTKHPVNCATGNFWHTFADVAVPGRGLPLALARSYNSQNAAVAGPFGYGWSTSYTMSVAVNPTTGVVTLTEEGGSQLTFTPNGTGGYSAPPRVLGTLVHNGDGTWTFTRRKHTTFVFSAAGTLLRESDLNGYTTTLAYNGAGQLATVTDPAGRTLTVTYWPVGTGGGKDNLAHTVTDSGGRVVTYDYTDGSSNLTDAIDVAGGHSQFTYDAAHHLLTMRAPKYFGDTTTVPSPVVTNHYDASGRVDWQTDELGRRTSFSYATNTTTITDPAGHVEVQTYTGGVLTALTQASGTPQAATSTFTFDPATVETTSVTDPNGHTTAATFDSDGNQVSATDALSRRATATYNALAEPLTVTDPAAVTTTFVYDGAGNLLSGSTPLVGSAPAVSKTTTYSYADALHPGDVTSITDADAKVWPETWDASGNLASVTDPLGNKTQGCYDTVGRQTKVIAPKGSAAGVTCATVNPTFTTTMTSNAFGDPLAVTDPLGHQSILTYDANRNRVTVKDALLHTTTSTFDPADELTVVTRPDSPATTLRYDYNADGTVLRYTDGANHATTYGYDPLGRVASVTDPLSRTTTYGYDPAGNQVTKADPGGTCPVWPITYPPTLTTDQLCTVWRYDVADQPTGITYSDGVTPNVTTISYDNDGRRTSMTDGTGTTSWVSDSLGRLTSQTNGAAQTMGYGYDLRGDDTTITYPGTTGTVTQTFDAAGRLTKVKDWLNHETVFNLDADSFLTSQVYPNGTTATNTPDGADRLMTVSHAPTVTPNSPFAKFTYGRDNADQVSSVTSTGVPADTHSYTYSNLNQLTGVDATTYGYDAADNLTRLTSGATQTFDAANQLTNPGYTFDSRGNRTAGSLPIGGTAGFTYDQANRLSGLSAQNGRHTIAAGFGHTLALKTDGTVWAWGKNSSGQLGNNSASNSLVPVQVTSLTGAVDVAAGYSHSLAVKSDGTVWAWGSNAFGELGNNTLVESHVPVQVTGLTGVIAVAAGAGHSLAVKSDGTVRAWGENVSGQLGNNTTTSSSIPVQVSSLTGAVAVAAGGGHSLTRKTDGTIWGWGSNGSGELGNNTITNSPIPVQATGLTGAVALAAGYRHSLALKTGGTVWDWGYNADGELGNNTTAESHLAVQSNMSAVTVPVTTTTYTYNGDGLRTAKTVSGTTTGFTWDAGGNLLVDGTTNYIYGPDGLPLEQITSTGVVTYYHHDQLGSTRALTNSAGTVIATTTYDPYGKLADSTGTATNPFGYGGQYNDNESGLVYMRARYYDPGTGTFLTRDPLEAITASPYGYVDGNPLNATDPFGLICLSASCLVNDVGAAARGAITVTARTAATGVRLSPVGAALDVASHITGKTLGACVGGDLLGGIDLNASLCYLSTPGGHSGFAASAGGGAGAPIGASALIGVAVSNARRLDDLSGRFDYAAGSAGKNPFSFGGSFEWGQNRCGRPIWQTTVVWTPGVGLETPFSYSAGINYTWTAGSWF
jgi:RHS repeat-associated protein